jgi:glycosyltransferase involved in cell wall biosynthesis
MDEFAGGRCKFLFQGRFSPGRGIEELIRAWAKVDGTRAALFLRGPDNMWRRSAMKLAAELGLLDSSVYFLDAVTEDRLIGAAAEADVGIIPYRPLIINDRLCCPNKLSQYLHAGLMVVANNLPFVKSVIADARAGLSYDSAKLESLIEVVDRIVADGELRRRSQENALRYARERFNWQVEGEKLYTLYHSPQHPDETTICPIMASAGQ